MDGRSKRQGGPRQRPLVGKALHVLVVLGGLALLAFIFYPADRSSTVTGWLSVVQTVGLLFALLAVAGLLLFLLDRGDRHLAPGGGEAMRRDKRAPVLYLRPFEAETVLTLQERLLARILERDVGPFVAIGKPGERLPQLGAARMYERDFAKDGRDWQVFVREMLLRAGLVLIVPGRSTGVAWEIAQCREVLAPQRLVVLLPGSLESYPAFCGFAAQAGLALPQVRALGWNAPSDLIGVITFDATWTAHLLALPGRGLFDSVSTEEQEQQLRQALAPTLERLGTAAA